MKDLSKLAEATKIPLTRLMYVFGIPLKPCKAETIEEAIAAFNNSEKLSEEQVAAFERWDDLVLAKVRSATTIAEVRNAYNLAPGDSSSREEALFVWIDLCTTIEELDEVENAIEIDDYGVAKVLIRKQDSIVLSLLFYATTFNEALRLHGLAPEGTQSEFLATVKLHEFFQE